MYGPGAGSPDIEWRGCLPVHGGRGYGSYSSPPSYYSAPNYTSAGRGASGGGSGRTSASGTRPRWSPSTSTVGYTAEQVRALTPYRRTVEERGRQPDLRDLFLCHAWDDRRGVAAELSGLAARPRRSVDDQHDRMVPRSPAAREY